MHSISAVSQKPYDEFGAQSTWGTIYYATQYGTNVTFKTAGHLDSRGYFTANGFLDNAQNNTYRPIEVSALRHSCRFQGLI